MSTGHGTRVLLGKDYNPGQARWCEQHERLECTKSRRNIPGPCHQIAIKGTNACRTHVGYSLDVATAKGESVVTAWCALGKPATGETIDSGMAVLGMLHMTWLRAAAYGELLRQQVAKETPLEPDREGLGPGTAVTPSGLIGYQYSAAGAEGTIFATSENIRALVILEAAERDRVVRFAKVAHDMGISERLTNLAERWGDVVVTHLMTMLDSLELTPEQQAQVPALIQVHFSQIDIGATGVK
jgi:hypothetical protein